jgi:uncharacterized protein YndB with AHSA1/START domain
MSEPSVIHHTFVIERNYPATPEKVFEALSDPAKRRQWLLAGQNHEVEHFEIDFRTGGRERSVSRFGPATPFPGTLLVREAEFQDIVPNRRVVASSSMAMGERRFSVSLETFELLPVEKETELVFTHQAAYFEGSDGPAMREGGWQKLLGNLEQVVTPQS